MKKLFKILLYIVFIVLVLLIVGAFLASKLINPNDYKGRIIAAVHEKTGRDLVIGNIEMSYFPWIGARVQDVRLSNAAGFQPQDRFMQVGEADVKVKLMPLFSRKVEVGKITLKDVELNLAKNKVGLSNWQDISSRQNANTTVSAGTGNAQPVVASQSNAATTALAISIAGIDIENANISWIDEQKDQRVQVSNFNLSSENPQKNKPFPISLSFTINSAKPALAGNFSFDSTVTFNDQNKTCELASPRIAFTSTGAQALTFQADQILVDTHQQTMAMSNVALNGGGLDAKLRKVNVQQVFSKPLLTADLQVAPFNLKAFLQTMGHPIKTQDPSALQRVSLTTQLEATASSLRLNPLSVRLDNSTINGSVNIADFRTQSINFDVAIDQINADHYLPPKSASAAAANATTPATTAASATAASGTQPGALRRATINGKLRVGSLTVADTLLTQVYAQIALGNGVLQVSPLNANVYNGSAKGKIAIDFNAATPAYTIDETLTNIDITQLVKSGKLTGRANLTTRVTLQGEGKDAMLRSLNGNVQFNIQNGAFVGKDIPFEVERAAALVKRQAPPPAPAKNQTDFGTFQGTGTFTNGIFSNNDLLVQSDKFKATGNGTANLVGGALNYHLLMVGLHMVNDAQGNAVQEERQFKIPVIVSGTLDNPIITPDLKALLQTEVGARVIQKATDRLEQRLGPGTGHAIGGALQRLLNR